MKKNIGLDFGFLTAMIDNWVLQFIRMPAVQHHVIEEKHYGEGTFKFVSLPFPLKGNTIYSLFVHMESTLSNWGHQQLALLEVAHLDHKSLVSLCRDGL